MTADLAVQALANAVMRRRATRHGCIFHSDRGGQFRSRKFPEPCPPTHDRLDGPGRLAGDNAAMESFYSLLQKNVLNRRRWRTRNELAYEIIYWIEHTYNRRRRQRGLGRLTPVEFELAFTDLVALTSPDNKTTVNHTQCRPGSASVGLRQRRRFECELLGRR